MNTILKIIYLQLKANNLVDKLATKNDDWKMSKQIRKIVFQNDDIGYIVISIVHGKVEVRGMNWRNPTWRIPIDSKNHKNLMKNIEKQVLGFAFYE